MRNKKWMSAFLTLMLSAGVMAGCGKEEKAGPAIKIGANLELSGVDAEYGKAVEEGIDLAIEEINKEGIDFPRQQIDENHLNGRKLKLIKVDNKSDANEAEKLAKQLINKDKVAVIIGSVTNANTLAQVQIAQDKKVPLLTPTATDPAITGTDDIVNDYIFRTSFISTTEGSLASSLASVELGTGKAAVLFDSNNSESVAAIDLFKESYGVTGGEVVAEENFAANATDFKEQLKRIQATKPEFLYAPGNVEEGGLIVKQARELGLTIPIMGSTSWDSPKLVEIAGAKALNNTFIPNQFSASETDNRIVQDFVAAFQAKYNKTPNAYNALGYDSVYLIVDSIIRSKNATREDIRNGIESADGLDLVSGFFVEDEYHNPKKTAPIIEFKDGKQVFRIKVQPY